ncbi:hypothetical protein [Dyadobacter sp. 3J3]|uniref:hypothetical protein n=1 Tax=Dyadobacter sp. 3J3 TaxID=2606600 RepID=UPI00135C07CD|nr:hypothetical protein [Dyadobacter sp. 3J3]
MSEKPKQLKENGVAYSRSEYGKREMKNLNRRIVPSSDGGFLNDKVSQMNNQNVEVTQVRNVNTGHWIKRNEITGEFTAGESTKPFVGVSVRRKFRAAANPSITREMAELAEKAVLAVLNRTSRK